MTNVCDWLGCNAPTRITVHGVHRCTEHYREHIDRAGHQDWRDAALAKHARDNSLTSAQPGENLSDYMARHGVRKADLVLYQRIPGEDDDRE